MDGYSTEEEQVEQLKKWWADNGKSAIFGVVLGLAAIFGWREWQVQKLMQTEAASIVYQQALTDAGQKKNQDAKNSANEILSNYGNTGYAVFARLLIAKIAAEEADYTTAEQQLSDALRSIDNDTLKHEVTLRLARIQIANNKADAALTLLNKNEYGAFTTVYNELKGDAFAAQGKPDEARKSYEQALLEIQGSAGDASLLNLKLDALGK